LVLEGGGKHFSAAIFSQKKPTQTPLKKKKKKGPDYKSDREVKSKIIIRSKRRENVSALSL